MGEWEKNWPGGTHRRRFAKQRDWETPEKSRPIPTGGRRQGEGKGENSPREATPSHPANRPRFLSKDFLRPDLWRALGPRREGARRARGESAKTLAARPEHCQCSPHTATAACSTPPSPQQDWTELANLNKRSPPPACVCVRAETTHRRDGKQKPDKQRESLQKGPGHQVKIPEGNTDYTGRGL